MKQKIQRHERLIGMYLHLNDVAIAKIAAVSGYDYVWIDLEHSCLSLENLLASIMVLRAHGTAVIVRVPQNDLTFTKKVLEMGVDGIIFPMVRSAEEANELIASTLYPPYGTRGFGPMNAINYGLDSAVDYVAQTCDHLCRFIQIEHTDAVNDLDRIMDNEYIDGYLFGPNDLSGSINELCRVFDENTTQLMKDTIRRLKERHKYIGIASGGHAEEVIRHWHSFDVEMITAGADFSFIQQGALQNRILLEQIHKQDK